MFWKKRIFWFFSFHLSFLVCFLLVAMILTLHEVTTIPKNHRIGNRTSNVQLLKEKGFPFSFLVIGDTQGSKRGERLIQQGLREGQHSFMIHLGDFVKKPDQWDHLLFLAEMTGEVKPPFPVFLVPGNHDIDYASAKIKDEGRRVTREAFDSIYGARRLHFVFHQSLFVLTEIDPQNPDDFLNYLREILGRQGQGMKQIFVFVHYPPRLFDYIHDFFPKEDEFYSLLETYKVTVCFFGHYHGYWRGQRNGVNYLIVGGGGRLKETQSEWGKFNHIMKVTVDEKGFTEEIIARPKSHRIRDNLKEWALGNVLPLFYHQAWMLYLITILVFVWGMISLFFFLKLFRGRHADKVKMKT
jgi:predicted phosphodiesterase